MAYQPRRVAPLSSPVTGRLTVLCVGLSSLEVSALRTAHGDGAELIPLESAAAFYSHVLATDDAPSAVIVNVNLPDQDGEVVIDYVRRNHKAQVIVTGASDSSRRCQCYERGADLVVPQELPDMERNLMLLGRIGAVVQFGATEKRAAAVGKPSNAPLAAVGVSAAAEETWNINVSKRLLIAPSGAKSKLTQNELRLLFLLSKADSGSCVSREFLMREMYGAEEASNGKALDSVVQRLRQKIMNEHEAHVLLTVYGQGHRFSAPLEVCG